MKCEDEERIDALVAAFFEVFSNKNGRRPALGALYDLCLPRCVVVKTCGAEPTVYTLAEFIAPRERLLGCGELAEFEEYELWSETNVFGQIAQRLSAYRKSGVLNEARFVAQGMKTLQFVKTGAGWKISAMAWDDERDGVAVRSAPPRERRFSG